MHIRQARPDDLPAIAALEARGFPPAEAASPESFAARFAVFPHCFFVAEDAGVIVGHINGCMTDFTTCRDELSITMPPCTGRRPRIRPSSAWWWIRSGSIRASARPWCAIFWKRPGSGARRTWSSPARRG